MTEIFSKTDCDALTVFDHAPLDSTSTAVNSADPDWITAVSDLRGNSRADAPDIGAIEHIPEV